MDFTPDQLKAIETSGNVLVMAGAGTGKTRTLVEHCVRRLLNQEVSIDQVLMLTFTEAAAAEMRDRIGQRLQEKLVEDPSNPVLHEQLALLGTAQISTLHSYCFRLLREYFDQLDLDPGTTVLTRDQAKGLQMESFDELRDRYYAEESEIADKVREFIEINAPSGEKKLRAIVEALHSFTQARPNPREWIQDQLRLYEAAEPSNWNNLLTEGIRDWACFWYDCLRSEPAYNTNAHACAEILERLLNQCASGTNTPIAELLSAIIQREGDEFWPPKKKMVCSKSMKRFFSDARFFASLIGGIGKDPLQEDWDWNRGNALTLLTVASEFTRIYATKKRAIAALDFQDLEQHALELLWNETRQPSKNAQEIASGLKWIYVDEYQDINPAQDRILRALHQPNAKLFMVGDVKQSIYRFRQAAPEIFQNYGKAWQANPSLGSIVFLSVNFRSTPEILDFDNEFFTQIMHERLGGVVFDKRARLTCGRSQAETRSPTAPPSDSKVEVLLRIKSKVAQNDDDENGAGEMEAEDRDANEQEALLVANRLRELHDSKYQVTDEFGQVRPFEWGDAVILLRAPRLKVEGYAKIFEHAGIPLQAKRLGFFSSIEVLDLINILTLLDNPVQDVPLLSVLRSPIAGLSVHDLAEIRLSAKDAMLWHALQKYHRTKNGSDLWHALDCFLKRYQRWCELGRHASLRERLQTIITETHYAEWLSIQPRGAQRLGNVEQLLTIAAEFDAIHRQGIYQFTRFIEDQQDAAADIEPAGIEDRNAVHLMSIHQSKGLEFPIVIVADLGKRFNLRSGANGITLTDRFGLATQVRPPGKRKCYDSLPYWLAQRAEREQSVGEELRLLYVAMTRAKQKLILAGTVSRTSSQAWEDERLEPLAYHRIARSGHAFDWLGPWLSQIRTNWRESVPVSTDTFHWQVHTEAPKPAKSPDQPVNASPAQTISSIELESLIDRIKWRYPFQTETLRRAKTSVSALRRQLAPDAEAEVKQFAPEAARRFARAEKTLSAMQAGEATHLFLQHLDFDSVGNGVSFQQHAERLVERKLLSVEEIRAIDLNNVEAFWTSPVGKRFLVQKENLRRELPFTLRVDSERINTLQDRGGNPSGEDFIVVQGVIDLAMTRLDEIWLLDFKTDRINASELEERIASYRPQLEIYKTALEKIYNRPVTNTWLHFLSLRETIAL